MTFLSAHAGVNRTKSKLRSKYFWYGLSGDVQEYIRRCFTCNRNKKAVRYGKRPMIIYQAGAPMERVHLDFIGPLPKTPQGNQYILMMVDQFTKWVECVPLPSQTAEVTAHAAVSEFFCRFGYPLQIFTDQGRNFESNLFVNLCKLLHIHKARTTPYRPSANGQVERFNRTLLDAIRCYIGKSQHLWDKNLAQIGGTLRSTVNRSFPLPPSVPDRPLDEYSANLAEDVRRAHDAARTTLRSTQRRMKRDYDIKVHLRQFQEGDRVYLLDSATPKGKCKKLLPPWKGPALIVKRYTPYLYRIVYRNKALTFNHDRLKKCTDLSETPTPSWKKNAYCFCRKADDGAFMIQCDGCDEWFHGNCVRITPAEGMNIDKFFCPFCKQSR